MSSKKDFLKESRDSWLECARGDRIQFLASLAITAAGFVVVGVGLDTLISGNLGGTLELAAGSVVAIAFGKISLNGIQNFADMTAITAVRQSQIDELDEK